METSSRRCLCRRRHARRDTEADRDERHGDGARRGGIGLNGSTTSFTGGNLTIVTHGNYNSANGFGATGITNQSYGDNTGGGSVQLTNSSITTTGSQAIGAANQNAGTMSISGGAIATAIQPNPLASSA